MKPMNQRKMDMNGGAVDSSAFFPESPEHKKLPKAGEIKGFKYPDTESAIHEDQQQFVKNTSKNMPKEGFRH